MTHVSCSNTGSRGGAAGAVCEWVHECACGPHACSTVIGCMPGREMVGWRPGAWWGRACGGNQVSTLGPGLCGNVVLEADLCVQSDLACTVRLQLWY